MKAKTSCLDWQSLLTNLQEGIARMHEKVLEGETARSLLADLTQTAWMALQLIHSWQADVPQEVRDVLHGLTQEVYTAQQFLAARNREEELRKQLPW